MTFNCYRHMQLMRLSAAALLWALVPAAVAQHVEIRDAPTVTFPANTDSNSPAIWAKGQFLLFNSVGSGPVRSSGANQFELSGSRLVTLGRSVHRPYWIESAWVDSDGTVFAWYHHEPAGVCGNLHLTAPKIGALVSHDGGNSFSDLGIILESGDVPDCSAQNGYFAGGHGDFSVLLGKNRKYFYFLFSNYGGPRETQGVAVARLPFERRNNPFGAVQKYYNGQWQEPGVGGRVSAIFPADVTWSSADTDAFWGPSVHWNTHLNKFVMLLNHSCCQPGWPQEGVYVSFNSALASPKNWTTPLKVMDGDGWYPQVLGLNPGETDTLAGEVARLYMAGASSWEIVFEP